jgi:hypothetical protein
MGKAILHFLKRLTTSRLGWFLSVLHLCLVVFDFAQKRIVEVGCYDEWNVAGADLIAGRMFHLYYETALLKVIVLLDMPGILLSVGISLLLTPLSFLFPKPCLYTQSWISAIVLLTGTSIQWCFLGLIIERVIGSIKGNRS